MGAGPGPGRLEWYGMNVRAESLASKISRGRYLCKRRHLRIDYVSHIKLLYFVIAIKPCVMIVTKDKE